MKRLLKLQLWLLALLLIAGWVGFGAAYLLLPGLQTVVSNMTQGLMFYALLPLECVVEIGGLPFLLLIACVAGFPVLFLVVRSKCREET